MMDWWVQRVLTNQGPVILAGWVFWVIFSICLHELSHGWAAIAKGDRTPIETGHMTWNPVVHMGVPSLVLFAVFGLAYGAMPVNPYRMRGRHADAFVSFAGPLMNVILGVTAAISAGILMESAKLPSLGGPHPGDHGHGSMVWQAAEFFFLGSRLNFSLAVFNMLPVPPLDGSRVLASFVPAYRDLLQGEKGAFFGMALMVLVFLFAGIFVFGLGYEAAMIVVDHVVGVMKLMGI